MLFCISSLLNFLLALIISVWQVMRNTFRLVFILYKLTFEFFACFNNICLASHAEYVSPGILFCISSLLNFLLALIISVWQVMRNTFRLVFYFV